MKHLAVLLSFAFPFYAHAISPVCQNEAAEALQFKSTVTIVELVPVDETDAEILYHAKIELNKNSAPRAYGVTITKAGCIVMAFPIRLDSAGRNQHVTVSDALGECPNFLVALPVAKQEPSTRATCQYILDANKRGTLYVHRHASGGSAASSVGSCLSNSECGHGSACDHRSSMCVDLGGNSPECASDNGGHCDCAGGTGSTCN